MSYHNINTSNSTQQSQQPQQAMQQATQRSQQNILTRINGEPLFRTIQQALDYGQSVGLQGYHTHTFRGTVGYMAGFDHSQATTGTIQQTSPKKITALDIDLTDIPNEGATRTYSIIGDDGASFMLQIVNASNQFYNFSTQTFSATSNTETVLKSSISGNKYQGQIQFPGSGTLYNVIVGADPAKEKTTVEITKGRSVINKQIKQVADTVITFALTTANTNNYSTLPTLTTTTGSKTKSYSAKLDKGFTVTNNAHDSYGFGLKLDRQPVSTDFVFRQTQTVDGAISSATSVVLDSVSNLVTGMVISAVSSGSLAGTPSIKSINTSTKTITLSKAQTFADGITLTFDAVGFRNINKATGANVKLIKMSSTAAALSKTVRGDVSSSTTITLDGTYGISKDNIYKGFGVDNSSSNKVTNVHTPSSSAGQIYVELAQTLTDGTKLHFSGTTQTINTALSLEVLKYPESNTTINILLDNFITPGTQT